SRRDGLIDRGAPSHPRVAKARRWTRDLSIAEVHVHVVSSDIARFPFVPSPGRTPSDLLPTLLHVLVLVGVRDDCSRTLVVATAMERDVGARMEDDSPLVTHPENGHRD